MTRNTTDTNQASEDELQKWWWTCNGTGTDACSKCRDSMVCSWHSARLDELSELIRTEKLKLLAEVRERVIGENERGTITDPDNLSYGEPYESTMADKDDLRAELAKLEAEL